MLAFLLELDRNMLLWIQDVIRSDILTPFFIIITKIGDGGIVWILISIILLIPKKTRRVGILSLLALVGSFIIDNIILKNLVARTRPYEVVQGLKLLIGKQNDFSFPSGHTGSSFASAVILYKELPKKYGIPLIGLATLIGFSRLYLGVHYPSDVLGGAIIGTLIAILVYKVYYFLFDNSRK